MDQEDQEGHLHRVLPLFLAFQEDLFHQENHPFRSVQVVPLDLLCQGCRVDTVLQDLLYLLSIPSILAGQAGHLFLFHRSDQ